MTVRRAQDAVPRANARAAAEAVHREQGGAGRRRRRFAARTVRRHLRRERAQNLRRGRRREGHRLLELAMAVQTRVADAGAGEDVVKMREEHAPPVLVDLRGEILGQRRGHVERAGPRDEGLDVEHPAFADPVVALDERLRGVAAGHFGVEFAGKHRQFGGEGFKGLEEGAGRGEDQRREDGPGVHLRQHQQVAAGRAAAMIADAVDKLADGDAMVLLHQADAFEDRAGLDDAVVAAALVVLGENARAVRARPPEGFGNRLVFVARPMQVDPADATANEVVRLGGCVAERVGGPADRDVFRGEAEVALHVGSGLEQVAHQRLARDHVHVVLDPMRRRDFPAPFADAFGDDLEQGRIELPDDLVDARLRLGKLEVGELLHQRQDGAERVEGRHDRLRPSPHPVHVDVRVADAMHLEFLRRRGKRHQRLFDFGNESRGRVLGLRVGNSRLGFAQRGRPCFLVRMLLHHPFRHADLCTESHPACLVLPTFFFAPLFQSFHNWGSVC